MQGERGVIKRYNGHVGVFERTLPLGNSYIYMYMCIVIRRQCIENENRNQNKCKSFCGDYHIHTRIYIFQQQKQTNKQIHPLAIRTWTHHTVSAKTGCRNNAHRAQPTQTASSAADHSCALSVCLSAYAFDTSVGWVRSDLRFARREQQHANVICAKVKIKIKKSTQRKHLLQRARLQM